jgi:hypothetical protein
MPPDSQSSTTCFLHPDRPAVAHCADCSRGLCDECRLKQGERVICALCLDEAVPMESPAAKNLRMARSFLGRLAFASSLSACIGLGAFVAMMAFARAPLDTALMVGALAAGICLFIVGGSLLWGFAEKKTQEEDYPLHAAAAAGDLEAVKRLADGGGLNVEDDYGRAPLHCAAERSRTAAIALLLERGADANARDPARRTPLHLAAGMGTQEAVEALLSRGADVNAADGDGNTPLHLAAERGLQALALLLVNSGARTNVRNRHGRTPADCAEWRGVFGLAGGGLTGAMLGAFLRSLEMGEEPGPPSGDPSEPRA